MRERLLTITLALAIGATAPAVAGWEEGVAAFKAGNYAQAAREFEAVVNEKPDWANGHMMLGRALLRTDKNQQAIAALRKAYDLSPADASIQLALAQGYIESNMAADAAQLLSRMNVAGLSKEQQGAHQKLYAMALDKTGRSDRAVQELATAAAASPNDATLQFQYGALALNSGDTRAAISALEKAVRLDAKNPEKAKLYVQALIRGARETTGGGKEQGYRKAAEAARSLSQLQPTYDNLLLLGEAQLGASDYDAAVATFGQAASKNAGDWLPLFYSGQAFTAKGSYGQAVDSLQKALPKAGKTDDKNRIWRQLGFVYEKQKSLDQAKQAYQNAGDAAGVARVEQNIEIAKNNQLAVEEEKKLAELKAAQEAARKAIQEAAPPPF